MRNTLFILTIVLTALVSCKKKTMHKDIIVPPPVEEVKKGIQKMEESKSAPRNIEWLGSNYLIEVTRKVDKDLPLAEDEQGLSYYDNTIHVKILRSDKTVFLDRIFTKADFAQYISGTGFEKKGAMLGIVFDKVVDDKLQFAASVGSPDIRSDEFIPLVLKINRFGEMKVTIDTKIDNDEVGSMETNDDLGV